MRTPRLLGTASAIALGAIVACAAGNVDAAMVTVDFDTDVTLGHGDPQDTNTVDAYHAVNVQYGQSPFTNSGLSLTFSANDDALDAPNFSADGQVAIFDSTTTEGASGCGFGNDDCDLAGFDPPQGNVLIVQENADENATGPFTPRPDDDGNGSTIKMVVSFDPSLIKSVTLLTVVALDVEEGIQVQASDGDVRASGSTANGSLTTLTLNPALTLMNNQAAFFRINGSGAIDDLKLQINPVPIPAALPLLLSAVGGLGFIGWRRSRSNTV